MVETFYGLAELSSPRAMFVAGIIGLAFGFVLERAGFGSSRRLAGIFYFRDMTVLKVMFTAVITAMLGIGYAVGMGWLSLADQVYLMPTVYGAQILGGLLFGVGFVISGWCPGTAAVGGASGKLDAFVFLIGAVLGSIVFNETFSLIEPLYRWGTQAEPLFAFGFSKTAFAVVFTVVAIAAFYFAEWAERIVAGGGPYLSSRFLRSFSLALLVFAVGLFLLPYDAAVRDSYASGSSTVIGESALLEAVDAAADHIEPEDLADRLLAGDPGLVLVDVRGPGEFQAFHINGAVNVPLPQLPEYLLPYKNRGLIVVYSNGMTHPAQARDALARLGYENAYMLTDELQGFVDRCLKPVSLRNEPLSEEQAERVRKWRSFFLGSGPVLAASATPSPADGQPSTGLSGMVSTEWLASNLARPELKLIDVRPQPDYNTAHIAGSVCLNPESFRGVIGGVSSMLLPGDVLASLLSLMGIKPSDTVVLVPGDSIRDATLVGMGLDRLNHRQWAILDGGFDRWSAEDRPVDDQLPAPAATSYPAPDKPDWFTVDAQAVLSHLGDGRTVIVDTRPADYYRGEKSDERRAGHIPGAVNRPYKEDLQEDGQLKPLEPLADAYATLIPSKDTPIIVHCRTGHQASQTYFVLKRLLGYRNVRWYDAGWTEWSARAELPVAPQGS